MIIGQVVSEQTKICNFKLSEATDEFVKSIKILRSVSVSGTFSNQNLKL